MISQLFLFLLPALTLCKPAQPITIATSKSPLDFDDDIVHIRTTTSLPLPIPMTNLLPRDCSQSCNEKLMASVKAALGSNADLMSRYADICSQYAETLQCLEDWRHCGSTLMFDALTSGVRYMCIQQKDAFEANLACVNDAISEVNQECNSQCHPESVVSGLTLKSFLEKDFKILKLLDPHMGKISMSESCRIGKCVLSCFRSKLNIRCSGVAGSLVTEVILRPFAALREKGGIVTNMVAMILPQQCVFLANTNELNRYRINPEVEESLKAMYADKASKKPTPNDFDPTLVNAWKILHENLRPQNRAINDISDEGIDTFEGFSIQTTHTGAKLIDHHLTPKIFNNFTYKATPKANGRIVCSVLPIESREIIEGSGEL